MTHPRHPVVSSDTENRGRSAHGRCENFADVALSLGLPMLQTVCVALTYAESSQVPWVVDCRVVDTPSNCLRRSDYDAKL